VLQQAVIHDPKNASLKADLIRADVEVDGVDGAVSRAREFAASEPDNNLYHVVSAELYEKAGRTGDAAALLEKALAARPSDDDLAVALARLYTRMGDLGKAETLLTGRLQTDPDNIAAGSALAPLYLIGGRPDDAKKKTHDAVLSRRPNDVAALIGLAYIAVAEHRWPQAMDYIKRARNAAPNDPIPGLTLGDLYTLRQDWKNARRPPNWLNSSRQTSMSWSCKDEPRSVPVKLTAPFQPTSARMRSHLILCRFCPAMSVYSDPQRNIPKRGRCCKPLSTAILGMHPSKAT
jgi:predicted Zn-dependent protease